MPPKAMCACELFLPPPPAALAPYPPHSVECQGKAENYTVEVLANACMMAVVAQRQKEELFSSLRLGKLRDVRRSGGQGGGGWREGN